MLNDRGRKVIKERMGGNARAFDQYKNMNSNHNDQFDSEWNQMAQHMGFNSNMGNMI